jgi:hypothetical protein
MASLIQREMRAKEVRVIGCEVHATEGDVEQSPAQFSKTIARN